MSRRKQPRPRHVGSDGLSLGDDGPPEDMALLEEDECTSPLRRKSRISASSNNNTDNEDEEKGNDSSEEFCPSGDVPSPDGCDVINACDKCGVCFTDIAQFVTHKKLCSTRGRILMPYDPPAVNGFLQNGYGHGSLPDARHRKDFSDGEDKYDSAEEDERPRRRDSDFDRQVDHVDARGRKRSRDEEDFKNDENSRYRAQIRSEENFILGLRNRMMNTFHGFRDKPVEDKDIPVGKTKSPESDEDTRVVSTRDESRKVKKAGEVNSDRSGGQGAPAKEDPAIAWALKAVERGMLGGNSNVTLEPMPATSAAVAQCGDRDEEVNMFRTMLFQLQQQQLMQIQMIQQMRRQLIASGVNPNMLPADIDLSMMTSEGLASVGAAMSGLQNATVVAAAVARDTMTTSSSASARYHRGASRSPSHGGHSRDSSPSLSENSSHRTSGEPPSSPSSGKASDRDSERHRESAKTSEKESERYRESTKASEVRQNGYDMSGKYLSPNAPFLDSLYPKHPGSSSPISRNPLEILQEKTAASLSSLPMSLGVRSTESSSKSPRSSLINSSALFASSPSLSALQKETDALKPSPILPPLSIPMTAEDYKGYIQRGTILERSQYASDDPFFKHKCRFCHKVFGSDSALQIHVRSHTGERPFKCNICGNRFSTKGNLKVHFERHKAKYPHIKMDATPVPEHLDRQPNLLPNFQPTPLPSSVPLPPPLPRLPMPPSSHPSTPSPSSNPPLPSHHSPFSFGASFMNSPGMPPFGLMPPPRDAGMHFPHPLSLPLGFPPGSLARRESPNRHILDPGLMRLHHQKESPSNNNRDTSPSEGRKSGFGAPPFYPFPRRDSIHKSDAADSEEGDSQRDAAHEEQQRRTPSEKLTPRSRHESEKGRSQSPASRKSSSSKVAPSTPVPNSPPPPLSRPASSHSPRRSPASVISWASLTSSPSFTPHHPALFSPHHPLPPGFPGLGLPMGGPPPSFHLPSPLTPVMSMSGPRLSGHSPFLHPPPPPRPQISTPPGDGSMFRNSILPTKTIDPSENLEQYMEVQKSETSKLEALVKNIEQKITDPNQCVVCHRVLSCKSALQMHYRIHTGERPFKCKICGRSFTTKGNLKTHMGVHRAKPALRMMHQCPVCHKQFTNVLVLQQHIRAHTGSMGHLPHMPLLPPHMDWPHRPPFGMPRHHPYLPPMPHDSLDLSRGHGFHLGHFPRERPPAMDLERKPDSVKKEIETRDSAKVNVEVNRAEQTEASKESPSRPHSHSSEGCDEKERSSPRPGQQDSSFSKSNFESTFLPPAFGNTPFDTPLAALEERVKAIDSQVSQTSFEKFRNSMGLDSTCFPNSLSSASNGSDPTSKPESPSSGVDMPPYGSLLPPYDARSTTCGICLKTFACKSALDIHYRSHTKLKPFQCDICERSFSTRGNLKQHLLTHGDLARDGAEADGSKVGGKENEDDDDDGELPNEDYPYEEDADDIGIDQDEDDFDHMQDEEFDDNTEEGQSSPKSFGDYHENNNNSISNAENNNSVDVDMDESNAEGNLDMEEDHKDELDESQDRDSPEPREFTHHSGPSNEASNTSTISSAHRGTENHGTTSSGHSGDSANRRSGGPKHQCMTCMKPFSSASALQIHTRTHTGDKPFKCTVCSKAFTTRGNLKVHMGTHMWNNSPSRRGRRMSIEPPFLLSHIKDNPFMPAGFPPRPPADFFYQYPMPMMNGPGPKMNEISVIQSLGGALPSLPPIPPHLMHGFLPKDEPKHHRDTLDKKPSAELDLSLKMEKDLSPRSSASTPVSAQTPASAPITFSSAPSPGNNKENSSVSGPMDLRSLRAAPWMWGAFPCHLCGQMFPSQDALELHARAHHHMNKPEPGGHMVKSEPHPPPPPKALLA